MQWTSVVASSGYDIRLLRVDIKRLLSPVRDVTTKVPTGNGGISVKSIWSAAINPTPLPVPGH